MEDLRRENAELRRRLDTVMHTGDMEHARMAALYEACEVFAQFVESYPPDSQLALVVPTFYANFRVYGKNARAAVTAVRFQANALLSRLRQAEADLADARRELDALRFERTHDEPPFQEGDTPMAAKQPIPAAPIRRPQPPNGGDVSAMLSYVNALESYCLLIENIGRTLERQNRRMHTALDQIDKHVVGAYETDAGSVEPCEDCGEMRDLASAALKEEHP